MKIFMTPFIRQRFGRIFFKYFQPSSKYMLRMSSGETMSQKADEPPASSSELRGGLKRNLEEKSTEDPVAKIQKSEDTSTDKTADSVKKVKYPKKKVAVLLSYCGVGYQGMQINPGTVTIEKDLLNAFYKTGAVPDGSSMGKMNFQRCARTDKGVSAIGQVVSLRMLLLDKLVEKLNDHLPSVIRVMDVKRTTGSFNSKHHCNYRTYMYLLPTFSFQDIEEITTEKYKITDEKIQEINELLSIFKGTHNFHNFTSGKLHDDMSANRYIMDFVCEKAFEDEGIEFAIMRVKGQSFMLHQIRKMIGLIIAIMRGFAPKTTMDRAFGAEKLDIPRAPGLGLLLESVHYDWYNKKWSGDGIHDDLSWEDCKEKQDEFKRKHIFPNIIIREKYNKSMMHWLGTLPLHTYDVIEAHNPMRSFLISEKNKLEGKSDTIQNSNEIPANVDMADLKPGQSPEEYLKTLTSKPANGQSADGALEKSSAVSGNKSSGDEQKEVLGNKDSTETEQRIVSEEDCLASRNKTPGDEQKEVLGNEDSTETEQRIVSEERLVLVGKNGDKENKDKKGLSDETIIEDQGDGVEGEGKDLKEDTGDMEGVGEKTKMEGDTT